VLRADWQSAGLAAATLLGLIVIAFLMGGGTTLAP
jgi:hypothetical protein